MERRARSVSVSDIEYIHFVVVVVVVVVVYICCVVATEHYPISSFGRAYNS